MLLVTFSQSPEDDDLIVSTDTQMTRVYGPVSVLVKMGEGCRRSDLKVWSHKWACIWSDLKLMIASKKV